VNKATMLAATTEPGLPSVALPLLTDAAEAPRVQTVPRELEQQFR